MKLIAICGMAGSGKTSVRKIFQEMGYEFIHLGVTEMVQEKYGEVTEDLENKERVALRKENGMEAMVIIAEPEIDQHLNDGKDVVIDNLYSWSEYKYLKKKYGDFFTCIAVIARPEIRYNRLLERTDDARHYENLETLEARDKREIETLEKGGPIAMAHFNIINEGNKEELLEKVNEICSIVSS